MTDVVNKESPVEPLAKGEQEPLPTKGPIQYPGFDYRPTGRKVVQFPLRPPTAGRPDNPKLVLFPVGPKGKNSGGAA